jgi:zinc D-Ala-D-Ala carboxypeptidase
MNLSDHFTLEEMTYSSTAIRRNIPNVPDDTEIECLRKLCDNILEPLRKMLNDKFGNVQIHIDSGFRSPALNLAVGGVPTSQHMKGQAVDFTVSGLSVQETYSIVKQAVREGLSADQVICEYLSWLHISYNEGMNRKQFLKIDHGTGYLPA